MLRHNSDEQLARQAQQGNREAFLKLYHTYLPKVYNRVKSRVPHQFAEDVTQEVFIAVIRSLHTFQQRSRFSTWLYTLVNRQIADFYRQRQRKLDQQSVSLDHAEYLAVDPGNQHERSDERALIQKALLSLPEHYQEVILLRFADGLTFAEIAAHNGKSLEAIKSLYRRAIQALRSEIGEV
ncbi:MAG: RNA polymerase sigma factor [Chloroflexi bacterium]|nr:RNA polymerase sigma factor [Chloroflexota bacterium]